MKTCFLFMVVLQWSIHIMAQNWQINIFYSIFYILYSSDPKIWGDRMLRLQTHLELLRRFLFKASERQARYYNKGHKKVRFQLGDPIMKKEHHLSSGGK